MEKFHHEKVKYIKDQMKLLKRNHQNIGEAGKTFIPVFNGNGNDYQYIKNKISPALGPKGTKKTLKVADELQLMDNLILEQQTQRQLHRLRKWKPR